MRSGADAIPPFPAAAPGNEDDLGPISPELVLVDPELAERARRRLPDPERARDRRLAQAQAPPVLDEPQAPAPPSRPRHAPEPRRTPRLLLAACAFAFGAIIGGLVAHSQAHVPRPTLEPQAAPSATTSDGVGSVGEAPLRPPKRVSGRPPTSTAVGPSQTDKASHAVWAANVIGVAARIGHPAVTLVWQKPAGSGHVVVLRKPGVRRRGLVVYSGSATSYRDPAARPCTAYRYTIVNYDRRGHRSTGVPTSIVTNGCGTRQ